MDHWIGAGNSVSRTLLDAATDFDFKDEVFFQSYYTGTAITDRNYAYEPRWYLPSCGSNHMNLESSDVLHQEEMDYYSLDNPHVEYTEIDEHVVQESSPFESSSTPRMMMETGNLDEYVCLSWGYLKEEPKMTGYWEKNELNYCQDSSEGNGSSISTRRRALGVRKPGEKRQTKPEKAISLEVLRQHFARSLKDAAKSMEVCPTTLKRICRQHGITRWPSRKIKKVNHSLKKLQLVVDSVYSTYPDLSSSDHPKNSPFSSDEFFDNPKHVKPHHKFVGNTRKCNVKILPSIPEDGCALKVKVSFGESIIRFALQPQWNFKDLQQEIARRFTIRDFSGILLKYVDSDLESILLTCDEDLEECKELFRSSSCHIIKMSLQQSLTSSCATARLV